LAKTQRLPREDLLELSWLRTFRETLVIGIIKLAKEKIHLQHHLDPFLKNIIEA
jgi:hypothetical protein